MDRMLNALPFLGEGLLVTIAVSSLVIVISLFIGVLLGLVIVYGPKLAYWPIRLFSDVIRGIPILVLIFTVYYGLPVLGVPIGNFAAGVLALSLFKTAHVIEIARGALQSVGEGQIDAGKSIGLRFGQRMLYVVLPQAMRKFLPPWINAVTDTVKGSALISLVGVVDLMLAIQQVIGRTYEPMPLYVLGALIYLAINYTLSSLSRMLEARYAYIRE